MNRTTYTETLTRLQEIQLELNGLLNSMKKEWDGMKNA